nr:MAG TPA: N acetylmuramidase [Caudoviricetes sp.]
MADINAFAYDMEWWCRYGNLGYDQGNRWDLREGGETDCSALVIGVLKYRGFDVGGATYTGNMARELTAHGWVMLDPGVDKQRGDILLHHANHVAVYIGDGKLAQASIDERGEIAGGQSGDQADETNVRSYYDYPWDCVLRYTGGDTESVSTYGGGSEYNPNGYGEDYVRNVQAMLIQQGYDLGADGADGILGAKTFEAIKRFQADHGGLEVDGIPGPQTKAALEGYSTTPTAVVYPELEVDGYWGSKTTEMLQGVIGATMGDNGIITSQAESNRGILAGCTSGWEFVADDAAQGSYVIGMMQNRLGVNDDGIVGPVTINALSEWYGLGGDGKLDAPSNTVMAMQRALQRGEF